MTMRNSVLMRAFLWFGVLSSFWDTLYDEWNTYVTAVYLYINACVMTYSKLYQEKKETV